jgi:hypothetical protein
MKLTNITAQANPAGNRIDLSWTNPNPSGFPGIQVMRREGTHPLAPGDGVVVLQGTGVTSASDTGLKAETAYYYNLFPFTGNPPQYQGDPANRISAVATGPYGLAQLMYSMLPALYHRYDEAALPSTDSRLSAVNRLKGPLRRFLDLPGSQFDQLYSLARAALLFTDLDRVEGSLLPLLAQWIGWRTDYSLEISAQRNELRFAPQIYQRIGLIPAIEATVKRITNWETETKEFVYNVALTNQPERLNLWSAVRPAAGAFGTPARASLNFVYAGRPTAVQEADGSVSFFYHTARGTSWDIWTKSFANGQWVASAPVVDQPAPAKNPSAAIQGGTLWLFWESQDAPQPDGSRACHINFQTRTAAGWSAPAVFGDAVTQRRMPAAVADNNGGVWLFWLEQNASGGWGLNYSVNNGAGWLAAPVAFPADNGLDPRVESDLFILFHPTSVTQRLWLFWARHEAGGPAGQNRWTIAYRIKAGLDPSVNDWSVITLLAKAAPDNHDREPCAILAATGVELFWSSTRNGGWTIFNDTLNITTMAWGAAAAVTTGPFSGRAPLAVSVAAETLLAFRSNQSMTYTSSVYEATQTQDVRYAGSTTVDARNAAKIALFGQFTDFQTYVYDSGPNGQRTNSNRIARDTIGLYLTPNPTDTATQIQASITRLANVLPEFMPASERAVFIVP